MERKAFVDREICIGCDVCSNECKEVFIVRQDPEHDGAFKSFPKEDWDHEKVAEKIDSAIAMCPVQCISWKEVKDKAKIEEKA